MSLSENPDNVRIPPVRLCCGQRHWGVLCPDGKVMCCICFSRFPESGLFVNSEGRREDICVSCAKKMEKNE